MKRCKMLIAGLLLGCSLLHAQVQFAPSGLSLEQYEVVGNCDLKVTYKLTMVPNPQKRDYVYKDIQVLEIGKEVVKSYSYLLYQQDSIRTALSTKGVDAAPQLQQAVLPLEIFRYPEQQRTEVVYRTILDGPIYKYVESMERMVWEIQSEEKDILGYCCRKAVATFRGRTYAAWFTVDIPVPYGPYKFGGLPGLILALEDKDGDFTWNCMGIKKEAGGESPIKKYKWDYTDISRQKLAAVLARMYADPVSFIAISMGAKVTNRTGKSMSMPYNPLEK